MARHTSEACTWIDGPHKKSVTEKKILARKGRRRARPERRRNAKTNQNVARARSRTGELNVATWNVRSLSLPGRRGAGHAEVLLQKCKALGCAVIGLQETRRPGRTEFAAGGCRVFCSGVDGSSGRAGQHGVGLAVKESIIREATWTQVYERAPDVDDFQLDRQVQRCHLCCGIWPDRCCVQYAGTEGCVLGGFGGAVSRVPSSDYLFGLIDANARNGVRMGEEEVK